MRRGIRARFVAFALLLVLLVGGAISFGTLVNARAWIRDSFAAECRGVASLLAEQVADPLYALDVSAARSILRHARVNRALLRAAVVDPAGAILAENGSEDAARAARPEDAFAARALAEGAWRCEVEGDRLRVGGPIRMPDGARVGSLLADFTLEPTRALFDAVLRSRLSIAAQCFGLGALLAVLFARGFTRPIRELLRATRAIEAGRFATRVPAARGDELGLLAKSVNRMAESLERTTVTKAHLDRILESMTEPLLVLDDSGRMRTVNAAAERLLGYRKADLLGRSVEVVLAGSPFGPESVVSWRGEPPLRDAEAVLLAVDGARIPVALSASPLGGEAAARGGVVCVARDLREAKRTRRAMEASEDRFRSIFEQTCVGVALLSPEGRVVRANAAFASLLGRVPGELPGASVSDWAAGAEAMRRVREALESRRAAVEFEERFTRRDGGVVWARVASSPSFDERGRIEHFVWLALEAAGRRHAAEPVAPGGGRAEEAGAMARPRREE